jgi:DNA invertase Pin-like site-specific DNA recombinase
MAMRGMAKRVAIYIRVSTDGQTTNNQRRELEAVAAQHNWRVVKIFADDGISGSVPMARRVAGKELLQGLARREFDMVASWSVDRLGRSLQDLVGFLGELQAKGVDLYLHQQGLDTSTPAGKAMFQMMGVFSEFERAMIVERVNAGLRRARSEGRIGGRPRIDLALEAKARAMLAKGTGIRKTAKTLGIGVSAVQRVKAEGAAPT